MNNEQFLTNVKGSATANFITGIFFVIIWILKNKCRHSKCKSHTKCFECSVKEDDDIDLERGQRGEKIKLQNTVKVPGQAKINLQKLHGSKRDGVLPECKKAIPSD